MPLTALRTRLLVAGAAVTVCSSLAALGLETRRVGLVFADGSAWLSSRRIDKIMLVDGLSGAVVGSVPLPGVFAAESGQSANPLLTWQATASRLRSVDAQTMRAGDAVTLPSSPSRLVSASDGSYAFFPNGPARYIPRDHPDRAAEIPGFTGAADDVIVDSWGVLWALRSQRSEAVPFREGRPGKAVHLTVHGTRLILRDGAAALFAPAAGEIAGLSPARVTRLSEASGGLSPVENLSGSFTAAFQPPRTLIFRNTALNIGRRSVELGSRETLLDRVVQLGTRVYAADLKNGTLRVYDLIEERELDPIPIDDPSMVSAGFEMFVKDGILWVNELDGPNAVAVQEDGVYRTIRKYDAPPPVQETTGAINRSDRPRASQSSPPKTAPPKTKPATAPPSTPPPSSALPTPTQPQSPTPSQSESEGGPGAIPEPTETPNAIADPAQYELNGPPGTGFEMRYSPNGTILAVSNGDTVTLWRMPSRKVIGSIPTAHGALAFSPDSATLAVGSADDGGQTVLRYGVRTLKPTGEPDLNAVAEDGPIPVDTLAYTAGGRTLIGWGGPYTSSHSAHNVVRWDLSKPGKSDFLGYISVRGVTSVSPDGDKILYGLEVIRPQNLGGGKYSGEETKPDFDLPDADAAEWSSDGSHIVTRGAKLTVYTADGQEQRAIDYAPHEAKSMAADADGSVVAVATEDGSLRFWDTRTGEQLGKTVTGYPGEPTQLKFAPDGRSVAVSGNTHGIVWIVEVPRH